MSNIQNIMDSFFDDVRPLVYRQATSLTLPALNVSENNDKYEITLTVPGIDSSKIKIESVDKSISISYNQEETIQPDDYKIIREEYKQYSFNRTVNLPRSIDSSTIKAITKNGILKIIVTKSPESKSKLIEIENL